MFRPKLNTFLQKLRFNDHSVSSLTFVESPDALSGDCLLDAVQRARVERGLARLRVRHCLKANLEEEGEKEN